MTSILLTVALLAAIGDRPPSLVRPKPYPVEMLAYHPQKHVLMIAVVDARGVIVRYRPIVEGDR